MAALEAGRKGLIIPILVGPAARIEGIARLGGIDLGGTRDRRYSTQPRLGREGGGFDSRGLRRTFDEG